MSGKKRGQNKTSNYLLAYHKDVKKNSPYCLGKVRYYKIKESKYNYIDLTSWEPNLTSSMKA